MEKVGIVDQGKSGGIERIVVTNSLDETPPVFLMCSLRILTFKVSTVRN